MRAWLIEQAVVAHRAVFDHCQGEPDTKMLKILHDNFNRLYKKMTLVEQGEVHHDFVEWLRQKG